MTDVVVEEQPLTTVDKFELLIKDFTTLMDTTKSLSARMKVLQKEVNKSARGKRRVVKEVDPDAPKKVSALQKPVVISNELCKFLGFEPNTEHSRQEVTASINAYIKANDLQDPKNRRFILLEGSDAGLSLKKLLRDPDQPVTFFNIQRYLKPHYPPKDDVKAEPVEVVPDVAPVAEEVPVPAKPPVKKRVVRNPKSA
jgi:chromatin remodeling complex protein RSC6